MALKATVWPDLVLNRTVAGLATTFTAASNPTFFLGHNPDYFFQHPSRPTSTTVHRDAGVD
jgi:hypothetical protein